MQDKSECFFLLLKMGLAAEGVSANGRMAETCCLYCYRSKRDPNVFKAARGSRLRFLWVDGLS